MVQLDCIILTENGFIRKEDKKPVEILGRREDLGIEEKWDGVRRTFGPLQKILENHNPEEISKFNGYIFHYKGIINKKGIKYSQMVYSLVRYKEKN